MITTNKLVTVKIKDLKPNKNSARLHSERNKHVLCSAVQHFKILNPPMVDQNKNIIAGNLRYEVAKELGYEEIQVIQIEHLSKDDIRAFIIAENKIAEMAGWDKEILKIELQYLTDIGYDTTLTGFDIAEIDLIINDAVIENNSEDELPADSVVEARSKFGDKWKLGRHILVNGDSTERKFYEFLLNDEKANISFVDFPYNVKIQGNVTTKKHHKEFHQASGEMTKAEFTAFLKTAMTLIKEFSTDGSIHFGCMDWKHIEEIITAGL